MISLILIKRPELRAFVHIHPQLPSRSSDKISILKPAFSKRLKHFCPKFWVRIILGGKKTWDVILEKKIGPYLKLLMARNVKKSPKGDGSVGRVQGDGHKCRVNTIYHLAPQFITVLPVYASLVLTLHNWSPKNVLSLM